MNLPPPAAGEAVDEGEKVGFGSTMPICRRRAEKAGSAKSGRLGSVPSALMAADENRRTGQLARR